VPIYEYKCRKCGEEFEELIRNAAHERELVCVACGSAKIERQLSVPAAPQTASSAPAACHNDLPMGCGQCGMNQAHCPNHQM